MRSLQIELRLTLDIASSWSASSSRKPDDTLEPRRGRLMRCGWWCPSMLYVTMLSSSHFDTLSYLCFPLFDFGYCHTLFCPQQHLTFSGSSLAAHVMAFKSLGTVFTCGGQGGPFFTVDFDDGQFPEQTARNLTEGGAATVVIGSRSHIFFSGQ